jgi:hypothetical protein
MRPNHFAKFRFFFAAHDFTGQLVGLLSCVLDVAYHKLA